MILAQFEMFKLVMFRAEGRRRFHQKDKIVILFYKLNVVKVVFAHKLVGARLKAQE